MSPLKHRNVGRLSKIKWSPLILLAILCGAFFYFDLHRYLSFNTIKTYHAAAKQWTNAHYQSAVSLYILAFSLLIACAIPCATVFTLMGGFLFGSIALLYAMFSTTLGGMILYFAVRTSIGEGIAARSSGWIKRMEAGFQQNAFNYLLMLRLVPVFPCWISNIGAGALNVPLRTFLLATVIGIFPSTFIYTMVGRGLDTFFSMRDAPFKDIILTPSIFFPLLGLAILSIFPVIYKSIKKQNPPNSPMSKKN